MKAKLKNRKVIVGMLVCVVFIVTVVTVIVIGQFFMLKSNQTSTPKNEVSKEAVVKDVDSTIKFKKDSLSLYIGEAFLLEVEVEKKHKPTYQSSDSNIVSVDEAGMVEVKKAGSATITVSANGENATCKVTVKEVPMGARTSLKEDNNGHTIVVITPPENNLLFNNSDYVKVKDYIPSIYIDLRYATSKNFTGEVIYDFKDAYLRYGTIKKLEKVQNELLNQGYSLKMWDAYRPFDAQKKLWQVVNNPRYVGNPSKGPRNHNLGGTVDITLVKNNGNKISMPTEFDDFSQKADRDYSDIRNKEAIQNVKLLENTMYKHGFNGYKNEWWDYTDSVSYSYVDFKPK